MRGRNDRIDASFLSFCSCYTLFGSTTELLIPKGIEALQSALLTGYLRLLRMYDFTAKLAAVTIISYYALILVSSWLALGA